MENTGIFTDGWKSTIKKIKEQNKKIEYLNQALYTLTYEKNYLKQANSEKSEIIQELRAAIIKMPKEERETVVSIFRKYKVKLIENPPQVVKKSNLHKQWKRYSGTLCQAPADINKNFACEIHQFM